MADDADHRQISDQLRELAMTRRKKVSEALADYDKVHNASLIKLQEACGCLGHQWDFRSVRVVCRVCGVTK